MRGLPCLSPPALGKADEELLAPREALDHRRGLAAKGTLVGIVRHGQAGYVRDVLPQGLLSLDREVGEGLVPVVLLDELRRRGLEVLEVRGGPPVVQPAGGVEQRTLVVEAVTDLVADDRSDG